MKITTSSWNFTVWRPLLFFVILNYNTVVNFRSILSLLRKRKIFCKRRMRFALKKQGFRFIKRIYVQKWFKRPSKRGQVDLLVKKSRRGSKQAYREKRKKNKNAKSLTPFICMNLEQVTVWRFFPPTLLWGHTSTANSTWRCVFKRDI